MASQVIHLNERVVAKALSRLVFPVRLLLRLPLPS